jgi:small redox-active disulfide protein 2
MRKLEVYGPGCPKCEKLAQLVREAAEAAGIEYELEKVTDINRITAAGVIMTPALAVDGEIKIVGKVPDREQIKKMIS